MRKGKSSSDMELVVHCKTDQFDVYIGRGKTQDHYGNPFSHKKGTLAKVQVGTIKESVDWRKFGESKVFEW